MAVLNIVGMDWTLYQQAMIFAVTTSLLSILYLVATSIYNIYFHPLSKFPGPKLYASNHFFFMVQWFRWNHAAFVVEMHKIYGPVVRVAPNQLSFTEGESAWPAIYGKQDGKPASDKDRTWYPPQLPGASPGILFAPHDIHQHYRRAISPAFAPSLLRDQEPIVEQYLDLLVSQLKQQSQSGKNLVDMNAWFNFLAFDIIGDMALGAEFNCLQRGKWDDFVLLTHESLKSWSIASFLGQHRLLRFLVTLFFSKTLADKRKSAVAFANAQVSARLAHKVSRPDFVTHISKAKDPLTQSELGMNMSTLVGAGSETTASALTALFYYLHLPGNRGKLGRLREEIRTTCKDVAGVNGDTTAGMPYLKACIDEILRLFPPVPVGMVRHLLQDTVVGGCVIPAHTNVSVTQLAVALNESYFHDAASFHPERWLPEARAAGSTSPFKDDHRAVVQPFSYGARNCVGKYFALLEMRLATCRLLLAFDMQLAEQSLDWRTGIKTPALWDKKELWMVLK